MGTSDAGKLYLQMILKPRGPDSLAGFEAVLSNSVKDIESSDGSVTCTLCVNSEVSNWRGTLHGGCLAALVDIVGSAALVTKSAKAQHSISISVNCMSAMPAGEDCLVVAKVLKAGSTVATVDVEFLRIKTGGLIASGRHLIFLTDILEGNESRSAAVHPKL